MKMKKIKRGTYEYKECRIINCGYHQPDHSVIWEASDIESGNVRFHAKTRKEIIKMVDAD